MAYELLDTRGFQFEATGLKAARLRADFGEGYSAGVRIGSPKGLRAWQLKVDVLPHSLEYTIAADQIYSRCEYLWRFWQRHKLTKDSEIFLFRDPLFEQLHFVRFEDDEMSLSFLTKKR